MYGFKTTSRRYQGLSSFLLRREVNVPSISLALAYLSRFSINIITINSYTSYCSARVTSKELVLGHKSITMTYFKLNTSHDFEEFYNTSLTCGFISLCSICRCDPHARTPAREKISKQPHIVQ